MKQPIDLYFWPTPNGWKITIALEEMGLPYTLRPVNIMKDDQFEPEFLKLSPNNRIPAIVDHDGPGGTPISVFESGAILQYLGRKTGQFYPNEERARIAVDEWLMWQMAGLGPMTGQHGHFNMFATEKIPYAIERYANEVKRLHGVMDKRLFESDYLAGDYSIADMACWPWVKSAELFGFDLSDLPSLSAWIQRVGARPKVQSGSIAGIEMRPPIPLKAD